MQEAIYFAAGFYHPVEVQKIKAYGRTVTRKVSRLDKPVQFGMVHTTGDDRPYLTRSANGLKLTEEHANIYCLSTDGNKAVLVNCRCPSVGVCGEVVLTDEQKALIQKSIETNYFFE